MAKQLAFDWPTRVALGEADFFVTPANAAAFGLVTGSVPWPNGKLAVCGPGGCGKSHLVAVWQAGTGAEVIRAAEIDPTSPPFEGERLAVEDLEGLRAEAQEWLFHTHNALAARGGHLLLTGTGSPATWPVTLPDLASRLQAATVTRIEDPDDQLLAAVLMKLFEDRQMTIAPPTLTYLLRHMDRSFAEAARVVAALDRAALERKRPITREMARHVVEASRSEDRG